MDDCSGITGNGEDNKVIDRNGDIALIPHLVRSYSHLAVVYFGGRHRLILVNIFAATVATTVDSFIIAVYICANERDVSRISKPTSHSCFQLFTLRNRKSASAQIFGDGFHPLPLLRPVEHISNGPSYRIDERSTIFRNIVFSRDVLLISSIAFESCQMSFIHVSSDGKTLIPIYSSPFVERSKFGQQTIQPAGSLRWN